MATDSATIYREILTQTRVAALAATAGLVDSRVTISPLFSIDNLTTPHVQVIVPGEGRIGDELSGVGLIEESFEVVVIQQIMRDRFGTWTDAVSHATRGIMDLVTSIRGNGTASGPASGLHNFVTTNAEGPITLSGWGGIRLADEDQNFIAHTDRYRILYELASYQ